MRLRRHTSADLEEQHGIDLAPMLDFVLNLLIFFIVIAVFVKEIGITVSKPNNQKSEKKAGSIFVAVRPNGEIWFEKRVVDLRAVRANVERAHAEKPDDAVVVIADKQAPTGVVVQVMDQVRQGGVENVSLAATAAGP
jgi:biopolymer transport protein ExbD